MKEKRKENGNIEEEKRAQRDEGRRGVKEKFKERNEKEERKRLKERREEKV